MWCWMMTRHGTCITGLACGARGVPVSSRWVAATCTADASAGTVLASLQEPVAASQTATSPLRSILTRISGPQLRDCNIRIGCWCSKRVNVGCKASSLPKLLASHLQPNECTHNEAAIKSNR